MRVHLAGEMRRPSNLIAGALVPLMRGIGLDVYVVAGFVTGSIAFAPDVGIALLPLFARLWFVLPSRTGITAKDVDGSMLHSR